MDISASQWSSSGCESGWTRYLGHSSLSQNRVGGIDDYRGKEEKTQQEEEDLSLVSDASSGPSYYHEDDEDQCFQDNGCSFNSELAGKSKKKKKAKEHSRHGRQSNLDDTASSPALSYPKVDTARFRNEDSMDNLMNFSQGFSATHFEGKSTGKSTFKKHFGFFKSSFTEKPASEEPGGFHGRNRK